MTLAIDVRNCIKAISKRKDVRVEHRKLGRECKKQWRLEYARDEHKLPDEIVDFYAEFNGFEFAWQSNGLLADPRSRARGVARMLNLDDLMWSKRDGFELMCLDNRWCGDRGLFLVRRDGEIRAGFATNDVNSLDKVRWLGSFTQLLTNMCERGFLPYEIEDEGLLNAVREKLLQPPPKSRPKFVAGTRVFAAKVKTEGFSLSRRGTIREVVVGTNGKKYAKIDWDYGDQSFTRADLLALVAEDAYEQIRTQDLRSVDSKVLRQLLDQFDYNVGSSLYIDGDPKKSVGFTCESFYWFADVSRATPLEGYLEWVGKQLDAIAGLPDQNKVDAEKAEGIYADARVSIPLTGRFGGDSFSMFHDTVDVRRFARALVESAALRWLRTPKEDVYAKVVALLDRVGIDADNNPLSRFFRGIDRNNPPNLLAVSHWNDFETRAQALGLDGQIYSYHG